MSCKHTMHIFVAKCCQSERKTNTKYFEIYQIWYKWHHWKRSKSFTIVASLFPFVFARCNGTFTLPDTEMETYTDTERMCAEPNGNLFWCLSLHLRFHTILWKPFFYPSRCWAMWTHHNQGLIHLEHEDLMRGVESPLRDQQPPSDIHIHRHREAQAVLLGQHVLDELTVRTVHGHAVTVALGNEDVTIGIHAHTAWAAQSSDLEQHLTTLAEHLQDKNSIWLIWNTFKATFTLNAETMPLSGGFLENSMWQRLQW